MELIDLLLEKKDGVATITLNSPDKLNAMSTKMRESLFAAMDDVNKDDSVKVVSLVCPDCPTPSPRLPALASP